MAEMIGKGGKADLTRDYYGDLELSPTASVDDIKKQFKKLALLHHPDRNPGREDQVSARFQAIQSAHEVLINPAERANYDANRFRKSSVPFRNPLTSLEEDGVVSVSKRSQPSSSKLHGQTDMPNRYPYQEGSEEQKVPNEEGDQQESASSSLDMMNSIRNQLVSDLALDLSSAEVQYVDFNVSWGLLDFINKELHEGQNLESVLTVSGSPQNAYATSCGSYLEKFWPEVGRNIVRAVDDAWSTKVESVKEYSRYIGSSKDGYTIWVDLWLSDSRNPNLAKLAMVSVHGPNEMVIQIAQQIAWLGSVFRIPKYGSLSTSQAILRKVGYNIIDISFLDLEPIKNEGAQCWHPLFVNAVLAHGFPIPERNGEIGIELPFELMTGLSRIRYSTEFEGGTVLKGFSTLLFPTSDVSTSNSVQWHCISRAEGQRIPISEIKQYPWVKFANLNTVTKARTFLGYYKRAYICVGTQDSSYTTIDFSSAQKEKPRFHLGGLTVSLGIPKFGGPSISVNYTLTRSLMKTVTASDFDGMMLTAKELSFILYDTGSRRGWLVPAPSVILHLALTWAHHNPSSGRAPFHPAKASWDGRSEALAALRENASVEIYEQTSIEGKAYCFRDLASRFWDSIDMIFDAKAETDARSPKSNILRGWEFMSIVNGLPNKQPKEAEVDGLWHELSWDPNIITLFCQDIGEAIKSVPADPEALACKFWNHVPAGHGYLTASMECLMKLSKQCGNKGECSQLTTGLYWPVSLRSPFDSCQHEQGLQCQLVQKLTKHPNDSQSIKRVRQLAIEGAVVFGNQAAKLRKNQARPWKENAKSQPEKQKGIVATAIGIQIGREANEDEDRSSGTANGQSQRDTV